HTPPRRCFPHAGAFPSRLGVLFFFSSRRRHTRSKRDWSSDVCSSDLVHQIRHTSHPSVIFNNLTNNTRWKCSAQLRQIDGCFCMTRPRQYAASLSDKRQDVTRLLEIPSF